MLIFLVLLAATSPEATPFSPSDVPGTQIDQIELVVEGQVVTTTQLWREARIRLAMRAGPLIASRPLTKDFLNDFRGFLISELAVYATARLVESRNVSTQQISQARAALIDKFGSNREFEHFLKEFDIDVRQVDRVIRRTLANNAYIKEQLSARVEQDSTLATASEEEALRAWLRRVQDNAEIDVVNNEGRLERRSN